MSNATCIIDGCDKPCRNKSGGVMCKMHYHRWYRHGSPTKVATKTRTRPHVGTYKQMTMTGHAIAGKAGKLYVHRFVLFEDIGPGWHPCHWCAKSVTWDKGVGDPETLQVDHLNGQRDDNRIENLVPSCGDCNAGRGAQRRHDALVADGYWSHNDTIAGLRRGGRVDRVEERKAA